MLPKQEVVYSDDLQIVNMPSKTYKIDFENNRIIGLCDGIEAVEQAIDIIFEIPRCSKYIYPDWYGHELYSLIGQDKFYVESEAQRMIKDALLTDDRIKEIKNFTISKGDKEDEKIIKFIAVTIFGDIETSKEVSV